MKKKVIYTLSVLMIFLVPVVYFSLIAYQDKVQRNEILQFRQLAIKGYQNMVRGDYKKSKKYYDDAYEIYSKDTKTLLDMAQVYRALDKHIRAKQLYKEVLEINENSNSARFNYATYLSLHGDYEESNKELMILIHKDRRDSKYFKILAINSEKLGNTKLALEYYALLYKRSPHKYSSDKGLQNLASKYENMQPKPKPMRIMFKYEKTQDVQEIIKIAKQYEKDDYDFKAVMAYRKVILLEPKNNEALLNIADIYMKHKSHEFALEFLSQIEDESYEILLKKGRFYQASNKYKRAIEFYEEALKHKQTAFLYHKLAVSTMKVKDFDKSKKYFEELQELDPSLAHQLLHAIQIQAGVKFSFIQSLWYETTLAYYKIIQKVAA